MRTTLLAVFVVLQSITRGPPQAQEQRDDLVAMRLNRMQTAVSTIDPATGDAREIYSVQRDYGYDLKTAPSGRFAALLEVTNGVVSGGEWVRPPRNRLVVITPDGDVAAEFENDVRRYVWCCGGDRIAAVTGEYREGGFEFSPTGAVLFDVPTRTATPLALPPTAYRLHWAAFDSSLYVRVAARFDQTYPNLDQGWVVRYHVPTRSLTGTPYRDIWFSPSGRYYLHNDQDGDGRWHVYDRESNSEVRAPDTLRGGIVGWAFTDGNDDGLLLHEHRPGGGMNYSVFDLTRNTVVQRFAGQLLRHGSASHGALVAQRSDSTILVVPRPER